MYLVFLTMRNIILLHGAIGAADQLEALKKELASLGWQAHSFNFSGHGKTDFKDAFGIKQFSGELSEFIAEKKLSKPDVFGYSMGGYVALYLASQNRDLLGNISTLGTKFEWSPEIAQKEIKMLDAETIKEKVPKFAAALQNRHGDNWETLLKRTAAMMTDLGNTNLLDENAFASISNKVLIGLADADTMVTAAETDHAAKSISGAQRFTLENAKHPIETIDVSKLARILGAFSPQTSL